MVAVLDDRQHFIAAGALIAPGQVLSSGHLVTAGQLQVRAGEWDRQSSKELYPHADRRVKQITTHTDFRNGSKYNNIALLQLAAPYRGLPHVAPIRLAHDSLDSLDLSKCFVSAWGSRSAELQAFPLSTLPTSECESQLRAERILWFGRFIRENLLCAAVQPSIESCGVDDGAPLVCPMKSQPQEYALVGLVNCGWRSSRLSHTQLPGVYSNVTHFADWITAQLNES
ncbi:hypothetical protein KR093_011083 [Drosophila rubida]|uniref:Peptidase S1 domain-containing protein n=1 Tax=Drosophila rubida TaxID=30044 RepID=A0AAD4K940_9MUSC|nr:hypothetical protein KR093_011083 [Drosophila rubida]